MAISINGSTNVITGVGVGGLPDGIVDTDMLAANAVTAAKSSGLATTNGITMADQWRITTTFQVSSTAFITSNWERNDTTGYGKIGTGMSESSGEFSFPSTGIYLVRIVITWYADGGGVNSNRVAIHTTTDNSSYSSATYVFSGVESGNQYNNMTTEIFFDVTDVSTHKVKFEMSGSNTRPRVEGSSNDNRSFATFIRLGDT